MSGKLKNRAAFSAAVDPQLLDGLRKLSEQTRIPASRLVDEALADLLKKHGVPEPQKDKTA